MGGWRPALVAVMLSPLVTSLPPRCQYSSLSSQATGPVQGEIWCTCRRAKPSYTGNLNFSKRALAAAVIDVNRSVDLVLRNCSSLQLELNFQQLSKTVNLRIEDTGEVRVGQVELAGDTVQSFVLVRVGEVHLQGKVSCPRCRDDPGLLNVLVTDVRKFSMSRMTAEAPVKLTGRHLDTVTIQDTVFQVLPWPGIFLHNATSVIITRNRFESASPRSISISQGKQINVTHNLLDTAEVLKVEQYDHMDVSCNRATEGEVLPLRCAVVDLLLPDHPAWVGLLPSFPIEEPQPDKTPGKVQLGRKKVEYIWLTVLAVSDVFGLLWVFLAVVLILVFLLLYGLHSCCRREKPPPQPSALSALEELLALSAAKLADPRGDQKDSDEYSISSRAHLAHGPDSPFQDPLLLGRPPQYVRVQGVKAEPGEDGVVCGSLTLGPSFAVREASEPRTLTNNILKKQTFSKV